MGTSVTPGPRRILFDPRQTHLVITIPPPPRFLSRDLQTLGDLPVRLSFCREQHDPRSFRQADRNRASLKKTLQFPTGLRIQLNFDRRHKVAVQPARAGQDIPLQAELLVVGRDTGGSMRWFADMCDSCKGGLVSTRCPQNLRALLFRGGETWTELSDRDRRRTRIYCGSGQGVSEFPVCWNAMICRDVRAA